MSEQLEVKVCGFDRKLMMSELVKDLERYCMNNNNAYLFGTREMWNKYNEVYNYAFD